MVVCLEQGADLHLARLMPLPLTVFCFSKIQIGSTFLVPAHLGSPGKRAVKRMCVCVCAITCNIFLCIARLLMTTTTINIKNCSLSTVLTATDRKQQKSLKGDITHHHIA